MENLKDCLNYLESLHPLGESGIELGLSRVLKMKEALNQQEFCPIINIAGTNGKGSTAAFLEACCFYSGKKVGVYTSPHLFHFTERMKINGKKVAEKEIVESFLKIKKTKERLNIFLSYFEFLTLAAFEIFKKHQVEILILEMGLGGRLDAVNIYEPTLSVLSSVALDHQQFLGDTFEKIGWEKAHSFRKNKRALCGMEHPPQSVVNYAQEIGAHLQIFQKNFGVTVEKEECHFWGEGYALQTPMPRLQTPLSNAALAVEVARRLGLKNEAIQEGIERASLKGRFEVLRQKPLVVADVAHNEEAMLNFKKHFEKLNGAPAMALLGMMKDKDIARALRVFKDFFPAWYCCSLKPPRGARAEDLKKIIQEENLGGTIFLYNSPQEAFSVLLKNAPESAKIAVFGSFHTVAGVANGEE